MKRFIPMLLSILILLSSFTFAVFASENMERATICSCGGTWRPNSQYSHIENSSQGVGACYKNNNYQHYLYFYVIPAYKCDSCGQYFGSKRKVQGGVYCTTPGYAGYDPSHGPVY